MKRNVEERFDLEPARVWRHLLTTRSTTCPKANPCFVVESMKTRSETRDNRIKVDERDCKPQKKKYRTASLLDRAHHLAAVNGGIEFLMCSLSFGR